MSPGSYERDNIIQGVSRTTLFRLCVTEFLEIDKKQRLNIETHAIEFAFVYPSVTRLTIINELRTGERRSQPLFVDRHGNIEMIDSVLRSLLYTVIAGADKTIGDLFKLMKQRSFGKPPPLLDVHASWSMMETLGVEIPYEPSEEYRRYKSPMISQAELKTTTDKRKIAVEQMLDACRALFWV